MKYRTVDLSGWMFFRAVIERQTNTGEDPYGGPADPTWETHIAAQPCRWYQSQSLRRGETPGVVRDVRDISTQMTVPIDADITREDRVGEITDPNGTVIHPGPWGISQIEWHPETKSKVLTLEQH